MEQKQKENRRKSRSQNNRKSKRRHSRSKYKTSTGGIITQGLGTQEFVYQERRRNDNIQTGSKDSKGNNRRNENIGGHGTGCTWIKQERNHNNVSGSQCYVWRICIQDNKSNKGHNNR
jgi:hypothetical protein